MFSITPCDLFAEFQGALYRYSQSPVKSPDQVASIIRDLWSYLTPNERAEWGVLSRLLRDNLVTRDGEISEQKIQQEDMLLIKKHIIRKLRSETLKLKESSLRRRRRRSTHPIVQAYQEAYRVYTKRDAIPLPTYFNLSTISTVRSPHCDL
ncbi:hypothetical protein FRC19_004857 [Serendipita sp. 401]|nr:hypothetical protein FRC15_005296 [Serendipita sp. 397]KAG8774552.1 hypothetical protein FRC16_005056 [Serendipita sp. 398]KAG8807542.1 hypothetical protein FRC18_005494 [Serendipita sp. 400]KAG8809991.1 hypothetical protein FRC19_004857 [Serendipita sp. 401]KAG8840933.1 hypothetical protein FRC20_005344 [Serendipita sp. 405]KAG9032657.1 hypothetical protein FS842_004060 [Serendipita sp. 407]